MWRYSLLWHKVPNAVVAELSVLLNPSTYVKKVIIDATRKNSGTDQVFQNNIVSHDTVNIN